MTEAWKIGAYRTDVLTGKVLKQMLSYNGVIAAGTIGQVCSISGVTYQVTAGKTFQITGMYYNSTGGFAAGSALDVRYADNAALTTNPVVLFQVPQFPTTANMIQIDLSFIASVPATKYIGTWNPTGNSTGAISANVFLIGYEV